MTYYLGPTGALAALPDPEAGLAVSHERVGGMHQLLSGARVRDTVGRQRTWQLSWTAIDLPTYGTLEGFFSSSLGPFYFFDPEQRNMLAPNESSGGDISGDTTGVTPGANVTVAATTNLSITGVSAFVMSETTAVVSGQNVLVGTTYVPVVPGVTYTFSAWLSVNSNAPGHITRIQWFDATKAGLSANNGSTIAAGANGFSSVTVAAPAGAAFGVGELQPIANNTAGVTVTVYTDAWQFEQAAARSTWAQGVGSPLVTVDSLSRTTPLAGVCDAQMTLVQVGG